jgi:cytochrome c-type biogenesis protein CcmH
VDFGWLQLVLFGVIAAAMAALALAFVLPRLLGTRQTRPSRRAAIALAVALPVLAVALYAIFGDPAALLDDTTRTPSVEAASPPTPEALRAQLVDHLRRKPGDARSWVLLARLDFEADRFADAAVAYARAIEGSPKVARDPDVWCEYADALGMAQGGSLAGKPRELIRHALTLDAGHAKALEMAGSAAFEDHQPLEAVRYWRQLLAKLPERSPERRELEIAIERAELLATSIRAEAR